MVEPQLREKTMVKYHKYRGQHTTATHAAFVHAHYNLPVFEIPISTICRKTFLAVAVRSAVRTNGHV